MGKMWVRLDTNINQHDKILTLLAHKDGHRAAAVYMFGLAWSGQTESDGHIPDVALPMLHGAARHAQMLVDVGLWQRNGNGYIIPNWADRQEMSEVSSAKHKAAQIAGRKGACMKHHKQPCGCWESDDAPPWVT